ncbi:sugar ABC transporter [Actinotalea ferrariae CF5-4]|uniref:Transport permease protein n=1 Tax=Actinotalea ferrariae CF5-4 TaxID=948458 RepID=A0A021VUB5_9CELL|nr:ABC transporter permease [Actinotalea ferrariae]EYR64779.1 sugar ABC transporter [Actinotalea ferrariae CF5-4]
MATSAAEQRMSRIAREPLRPFGPQRGIATGTVASVRDIWGARELVGLLVRRELRARYKNSSLGFVWSLFKPIAQLAIYFVVIGQFLQLARNIPDFAIFIFAGLTVWGLFNEVVAGGTGSIVANSGLVKKVYLPREVFPLSTVGAGLFNFGIQFVVLTLGTVIAGAFPAWANLIYVPLGLVLVMTFSTALAVLLSALNVYLRDVQHLVEIVMLILFWASPIIYSYKFVTAHLGGGFLEELYLANPVTLAVLAFQRGMWVGGAEEPFPSDLGTRLVVATMVSMLLLWVAQRVFSRLEGNFAQEL